MSFWNHFKSFKKTFKQWKHWLHHLIEYFILIEFISNLNKFFSYYIEKIKYKNTKHFQHWFDLPLKNVKKKTLEIISMGHYIMDAPFECFLDDKKFACWKLCLFHYTIVSCSKWHQNLSNVCSWGTIWKGSYKCFHHKSIKIFLSQDVI